MINRLSAEGSIKATFSEFRARRPMMASWGLSPSLFTQYHPDIYDEEIAKGGVQHRMLNDMPPEDPNTINDFEQFVKTKLKDFPRFNYADDFDLAAYLKVTNQPGSRKEQITKAWNDTVGMGPTHCKSFLKAEVYPTIKHARTINARVDYCKAMFGPYFHKLDCFLKESKHFIKGKPVRGRSKYIKERLGGFKYYYSTDFTSFESGFNVRFMKACELQIYRECFGGVFDVDLMSEILLGKYKDSDEMRFRTFTAKIKGRRRSGDMCTSLGNTLSNFLIWSFIFRNFKEEEWDGLFEGDDGLLATNVEIIENDLVRLGFKVKLVKHENIGEASFCGQVFTEETYKNLADPVEIGRAHV